MGSLKSLVRKVTRGIRVPISAGPCQGQLWSLPTRKRFLNGAYEARLARFVAAALRTDDIFWDVGAHFGYYTLLASRLLTEGRCVAFEPNPDNRWYLEHHLLWNRLTNVTVLPFAIAAGDATRGFGGSGTGDGKLDGGELQVQVRSIDSLVASGACPAPMFMKIDTEGAELEVLTGTVFARGIDVLCIATHSPELHAECKRTTAAAGYCVRDFPQDGLVVASRAERVIADSAWQALCEEPHTGQIHDRPPGRVVG